MENSSNIELRVLGGAGLKHRDGVEARSVLAQPKRFALLVHLALAGAGRMERRDTLLSLFWPESDEERARSSLRTSLHFLRRALGEEALESRGTEEVGLAPGKVWCDAVAFRERVESGRWVEAIDLYRGPLLPGFHLSDAPDWERRLEVERDRLRRMAERAMREVAEVHEAAGEQLAALEVWRRLSAEEPYQGEVAVRLMRALCRVGDRAGALEHVNVFTSRLREEFGAEPDAQVLALAKEIRSGAVGTGSDRESSTAPIASAPTAGRPDASDSAPGPAVGAAAPPATSALPLPPTPLIGRDAELTKVLGTLVRENVRLLTLTGPGGIGKTRLALAAAREARPHFADGAAFVDLAPLADHVRVLPAIAEALDVKEDGSAPLGDAVRDHLRTRSMLLVLDNFEHVLEAATTLTPLLDSAPRLKLLATSREPLRLRAEHEHPVPPLGRYPAIELFATRARAVQPSFELTEANHAAVADICARLDGLPLAIELAAARTKLLHPRQILARLTHSLAILTGGARDLPARHQTLRAAIAWSHDLLPESERQLFRRLAVFVGGWTLEAATAIYCAADGAETVSADTPATCTLDGLASLLDKSLLLRRDTGDEPRFAMLETIHEFALEQLESSGEAEELRRRHAAFFLAYIERDESRTSGARQGQWLQRIEEEHDNLRAVMQWSLDRGEAETALRIAASLSPFWFLRSHLTEGRQWLSEALAADTAAAAPVRAKALYGKARIEFKQDVEAARSTIEECLALCRRLEEPTMTGRALNLFAAVLLDQGETERAETLLEESVRLQRQAGNRSGETVAVGNLGMLAYQREDYPRAAELYEQGLRLSREVGETSIIADMLGNLGEVMFRLGDLDRAAALNRESLVAHREVGNRWGIAVKLTGLAGIAAARGEAARSARLFGAAEALFAQLGADVQRNARHLVERDIDLARAQLDDESWRAAWDEGRDMLPDQAIEFALES
jgi:predicted ATPase/DNA-binding SARP family transcriptional activator